MLGWLWMKLGNKNLSLKDGNDIIKELFEKPSEEELKIAKNIIIKISNSEDILVIKKPNRR